MRHPVLHLLLAASLCSTVACASTPFSPAPSSRETWAFLAPWDTASRRSAAEHSAQLSTLVSGWIALDSLTGAPRLLYSDTTTYPARRAAIVTTYTGGRFQPSALLAMARSTDTLAARATAIAELATTRRYAALVLDFENMSLADTVALANVVSAVASAAHAHNVQVIVAVNPGDTARYGWRHLPGADALLLMLYDEHWAGSTPGAIAEPDWVRRMIALRVAEVGADHLIASLPAYGYRWNAGAPTEVVSYRGATVLAARDGVQLERDGATSMMRALVPGRWEMWVSDAGYIDAMLKLVSNAGVTRVALWRLGQEDPAVWETLAR